MQSVMHIILAGVLILLVPQTVSVGLEPLGIWQNLTIARVRIIESSLVEPYESAGIGLWYDSGFPTVDYETGTYNSSFEVIEVLVGDRTLERQQLETGVYYTQQPMIRQIVIPIEPPFQPNEEVVIFIHDRGYGSPQLILGSGVRYIWLNRHGFARPQTNTYDEDLEKIKRLVAIANAEAEEQWDQLRDLALHDRTEFSTWAIDTVVTEYHVASPDSENRQRALDILRELVASPPKHLTARGRWELISRLNTDDTRDLWYAFMESLVTSDYEESRDMWAGEVIKSALLQMAELASMAARAPDHYTDEVRERVQQLYARALANKSVPVEERLSFVERLTRPEERSPTRFTDQHAFEILFELLRRSDESEIEVAAAQAIRDDLPLTIDRRKTLGIVLDEVQNFEAALMIRLHIAPDE